MIHQCFKFNDIAILFVCDKQAFDNLTLTFMHWVNWMIKNKMPRQSYNERSFCWFAKRSTGYDFYPIGEYINMLKKQMDGLPPWHRSDLAKKVEELEKFKDTYR